MTVQTPKNLANRDEFRDDKPVLCTRGHSLQNYLCLQSDKMISTTKKASRLNWKEFTRCNSVVRV